MSTRNLIVRIIGDERALTRAFRNSTAEASRFEAAMERSFGPAAAQRARRFNGLAATVRGNAFLGGLTGGAAAVGAAEVAQKLRESIAVASNLNEQMARSQVVFRDSADEIDEWAKTTATSMGLARDQAYAFAGTFGLLFTNIGESTGRASQLSQSLVRLASDLASFNNTSVEDALQAIRSGLTGEIEPLRRYGVFLSEARTKVQALADTHKRSAGDLTTQDKVLARYKILLQDTTTAQGDFLRTSEQLANQSRILSAQLRNLQADFGALVTPYLEDVVGATNDTITGLRLLGTELDNLSSQIERVTGQDLGDGVGDLAKNIARTTLEANLLTKPLADAVDILIELGKSKQVFVDMTNEANAFRTAISLKGLEGQTIFDLTLPDFTSPKTGPTAPFKGAPFDVQGGLDVFRKIGDNVRGALDGVNADLDLAQKRIDEANARAERQRQGFETLMDRLGLRVDMAAATGNLDAQLAGLRKQETTLREQVRIEGHTVELDRRLFELRQERQQLLGESRSAIQFKALGLNADGTARVPGVENLRKQLGSLSERVKGTPLDTDKTRGELRRIGKVLSGEYGKVGDDVRSAILRMFEKIRDALKSSDKTLGPLTKTTQISANQITRGIDIPAQQKRIIDARLSHFNSAGIARAGAGIGGVLQLSGQPVIVESNVTVQIDGQKVEATVTKNQQKRRRRNPAPRSGPGAGVPIA